MPRLPEALGPRAVSQARTAIVAGHTPDRSGEEAQIASMSQTADGLYAVAGGFARTSDELYKQQQEHEAAVAADAEVEFAGKVRDFLHNPETGYLAALKQDAVAKHKDVKARLDMFRQEAMKDLPPGAQERLSVFLDRRIQAAQTTADTHARTQNSAHLEAAADARMQMAASDALMGYMSNDTVNASLREGVAELNNRARRLGWGPEELAAAKQEYVSTSLSGIVFRRAQDDPIAALEYARANEGRILPGHMAKIEGTLEAEAKQWEARRWVDGRYGGTPMTGAVDPEFVTAEGKNPDLSRVRPEVMEKLGQLQGELGRKLPINSGYRGALRNKAADGATRSEHLGGNAVDIDVRGMTKPERLELIRKASALGFTGIGVYNNAIHLDLGGRRSWGPKNSEGKYKLRAVPDWAKETINAHLAGDFKVAGGDVMQQAMEIADPVVRDAAVSEIAKRQQIEAAQQRMKRQEAQRALFDMVEAGTDPASAPAEVRRAAGLEVVRAMENYYVKKETGQPVQTDPQTYIDLANMPADEFRALDLMAYRDKLSEVDFKRMADRQANAGGDVSEMSMPDILQPAQRIFNSRGIFKGEPGSPQAQEYARLEAQMVRAIDQWAAENPGKVIPRSTVMSLAESFAGTYRAPQKADAGGFDMSPSALRSAALAEVRAKIGTPSKNPEEIADFERAHLEAARAFRANTGQDPTTSQAADMASDMLTKFHIDGGGFVGLFSGEDKFAYQITAEELAAFGRGDLVIEFDGRKITQDEMRGAAQALRAQLGRDPEIYELMAAVSK